MEKITDRHSIKDTTRGGQVFLHNLRMIAQVLNKVLLWTLPLLLMSSFLWFMATTDKESRYEGKQWLAAQCRLFFNQKQFQEHYILPDADCVSEFETKSRMR